MAVSLKHTFTSNVADSGDANLVQPSNWNAEHNLTMDTSRLLGRTTANTGSVEEISVAGNLTLSGGSLTGSEFPSGTTMLFQQTAAPTGWTKVTTYNDYALRVVSGSASTGGTVAFSTVMSTARTVSVSIAGAIATGTLDSVSADGTVDARTLTLSQIPAHSHTITAATQTNTTATGAATRLTNLTGAGASGTTSTDGGGGSHTHPFTPVAHTHTFTGTAHTHSVSGTTNLNVQYVDVIIASKN